MSQSYQARGFKPKSSLRVPHYAPRRSCSVSVKNVKHCRNQQHFSFSSVPVYNFVMNYSVIQPMDCPDNKPKQIINAADFRSLDDPTSNTKEFPCWGNDTVWCDKLRYARVHKSQAPGRRGHYMLCGDAWYLCTLSKELASCFLFLACRILRLFLDFWKVCAP